MADQIKGITVEIGGNTVGLNKALQSTNKEINGTQKELREVEKALKLDPTNTDLLRQKQELLAKSVQETKVKVDALKAAKEKADADMANGTEINQEQYRKLQREIVTSEDKLKGLETQADNSNVALSKISSVSSSISTAAGKVASATSGMSIAAGGALTAIGGMAYKAVTGADDLNTLANQSGFTTEQLQEMSYASDLVDVSVEDITGAATKMRKSMVSTSADTVDAWKQIGVSVTDSNGNLRDSNTVFYEALQGLSGISNETERDTLAMQIFGKSADQLAGIIDDGGASLQDYGQQAKDAGLIMSQDAVDGLNEVNDQIDTLKAKASATIAKDGATAMQAMLPVFDKVNGALDTLLQWIGSLSTGQITAILGVLAVIAAISPIAGLIAGISGAIAFVSGTAIPGLSAAMTFLAANPIVLIIAGIVALVAAFVLLWNKCDAFRNFFLGMFAAIQSGVSSFAGALVGFFTQTIPNAMSSMVSMAKAPLNGIIGLLNGAVGAINSLIGGFNRIGFTMPKWLGGGSWHPNLPSIPSIPYLAKGGTVLSGSAVVGEAGPELLTVLGNKTMVQPLTSQQKNVSYGGNVINVYGAVGQDVSQLAEIVADKINANVQQKGAAFA